ncbi:CBO0543 family protein [Texcoconibacillus texcoconensis]|uniref:Uncharacterized protein n=1 Tax=Texcoconibacillus texcoconensis TaxID=1095777 RepID=A0A840QSR9_9BACI|nr:CBO0543 family protein [Texcoconibacillus texcoconensis]MBB5174415.1 hypothetical protein [Texcoconibacillus texcoconensis]
MKSKLLGQRFLRFILVAVIVFMPIILKKRPIKDWIIVYLFNAVTNGFIDNILTSLNIVKYPVRLLPKLFDISLVFDFFVYPFITIIFNQFTDKDKPFAIAYKLFLFAIPMLMIELWAEKKTSFIKWKKDWSWYHTFFGIILKSLLTRLVIGAIRKVDVYQKT